MPDDHEIYICWEDLEEAKMPEHIELRISEVIELWSRTSSVTPPDQLVVSSFCKMNWTGSIGNDKIVWWMCDIAGPNTIPNEKTWNCDYQTDWWEERLLHKNSGTVNANFHCITAVESKVAKWIIRNHYWKQHYVLRRKHAYVTSYPSYTSPRLRTSKVVSLTCALHCRT